MSTKWQELENERMGDTDLAPYEQRLLDGKVTEDEKSLIVDSFVETTDIRETAERLDLPVSVVKGTLANPAVLQHALLSTKAAISLEFVTKVFARLMKIVESGKHSDSISAARLLAQILGYKSNQSGGNRNKDKKDPFERTLEAAGDVTEIEGKVT